MWRCCCCLRGRGRTAAAAAGGRRSAAGGGLSSHLAPWPPPWAGSAGAPDAADAAGPCSALSIPVLPADRSDFDVHGALEDDKVHEYVIL